MSYAVSIDEIRATLDALGDSAPPSCGRCEDPATHLDPSGVLRSEPLPVRAGPRWLCDRHAEAEAIDVAANDAADELRGLDELVGLAESAPTLDAVLTLLRTRRGDQARLAEILRENSASIAVGAEGAVGETLGRRRKLLDRILSGGSDAAIPFEQTRSLLLALGFEERVRGSHHVFTRKGVEELVNLQDVGGECKPYQVRQLRELAKRYNLREEL